MPSRMLAVLLSMLAAVHVSAQDRLPGLDPVRRVQCQCVDVNLPDAAAGNALCHEMPGQADEDLFDRLVGPVHQQVGSPAENPPLPRIDIHFRVDLCNPGLSPAGKVAIQLFISRPIREALFLLRSRC